MPEFFTMRNLMPLILLVGFVLFYILVTWVLNKRFKGSTDKSLITQIVLFTIISIGIVTILLSIPFDEEGKTRSDIITLLGYIISGIIALSSATFIGNALAGVMLRAIQNFKAGDFIEVQGYQGRVSERGLFHTEIQMETSDLTTIPNLFLVTNPVNVTRASGTFVSSVVSLGYDVPRQKIEQALLLAAEKSNLADGFVIIESLGDYSVVYRIHGKLNENKNLLSSKSKLNAMVLDTLHDVGIEIVSPTFMNQRPVGEAPPFIAEKWTGPVVTGFAKQIDKLIFDKALEAAHLENKKVKLIEISEKCEVCKEALKNATEEQREGLERKIARYEKMQVALEKFILETAQELKKGVRG